jgi:hypothetical protein
MLSVSERVVEMWLSRIDKDNPEKREVEMFNLWLACYTQDEIAEMMGVTQDATCRTLRGNESFLFCVKVGQRHEIDNEQDRLDAAEAIGIQQRTEGDALAESADLPESLKPASSHRTDFEPPVYNVWKRQEKKTPGVKSSR